MLGSERGQLLCTAWSTVVGVRAFEYQLEPTPALRPTTPPLPRTSLVFPTSVLLPFVVDCSVLWVV